MSKLVFLEDILTEWHFHRVADPYEAYGQLLSDIGCFGLFPRWCETWKAINFMPRLLAIEWFFRAEGVAKP